MSDAFRFTHDVEVRFRDLDPMGHAHHSLPLILFEEARARYWREVAGAAADYIMGEVHVRYEERIRFPDRVRVGVRTTRLGTKSFEMEYEVRRAENGALLATGRSVQVVYDYAADETRALGNDLRRRLAEFEDLSIEVGR
ncbi:MAG: acyl-CoA thioesterase [Gemmatimonadota bacterium]